MFTKIMVPLDGLPSAEVAIAPAAQLAQQLGAELHLVLVDSPGRLDPMSDEFFDVDGAAYRNIQLCDMAQTFSLECGIRTVTAMVAGSVVGALAAYVEERHVDLIMMATHGCTGWHRAWVGSVADDLMHAVTIPLLLVRVDDTNVALAGVFRRILVGLDGSDRAERALTAARSIARRGKSTLLLARVVVPVAIDANLALTGGVIVPDPGTTQALVDGAFTYLERLAEEIRSSDGLDVEIIVDLASGLSAAAATAGHLAKLARQKKADLVAITTRERGASRLVVRSVADKILHDTDCALLIAHGQAASDASLMAQREVGAFTLA